MQNKTEEVVFLDRGSLRAKLRPPAFPTRWKDYDWTEAVDVVGRLADATVLSRTRYGYRAKCWKSCRN